MSSLILEGNGSDAVSTKSVLVRDTLHEDRDICRKLLKVSALCFLFSILEVVGGVYANSLAVLSISAHLFANLLSSSSTILAANISQWPSRSICEFGHKRVEAFAVLFSMSSLVLVSFFLAGEAARRAWLMFLELNSNSGLQSFIDGRAMSVSAAIGVVVNLCLVAILGDYQISFCDYTGDVADDHSIFHSDSRLSHGALSESSAESDSVISYSTEDSLLLEQGGQIDKGDCNVTNNAGRRSRNIYSYTAYIHVVSDLVQSLFVFLAGILIWFNPRWEFMDPICTISFFFIVAKATYGIFFTSIQVLMNTAPPDIDWLQVYNALSNVKGVSKIRNLHIWVVSEGNTALSVHGDADDIEEALHSFHIICKKFRIRHSTIQLYPSNLETSVTCRYVL